MVERMHLESCEFKSWLCCVLALWPEAHCLPSLGPRFLISNMEKTKVLTSKGCGENAMRCSM